MRKYFFLLLIVLISNNLNAHEYDHNDLIIKHPYTNQIRPEQKFVFYIENIIAKEERLIKVTSPYAETVEIHRTIKDNNIMKMRKIDKIEIPSNKVSHIKNNKNGYHIMLINIDGKLKNKEVSCYIVFYK